MGDVDRFDRFAPVYDRVMPGADSDTLERGFDRADREIRRVVDIGGGTGRGVRALGVEQRLVVDPARGMLEEARKHGLDVIRGDGAQLPLATETVDGVLVIDALHHIHDQYGVFDEASRILRPGGVLVVSEFDPTTIRGRLLEVGEQLVGFESTFLPADRLSDAMSSAGFETTITEAGFGYTVAGVK